MALSRCALGGGSRDQSPRAEVQARTDIGRLARHGQGKVRYPWTREYGDTTDQEE